MVSRSEISIAIVRSRPGRGEPRFENIRRNFEKLGFKVELLNWARLDSDDSLFKNTDDRVFQVKRVYGLGLKNFSSMFLFQVHIWRQLRKVNPEVIYSCDLDTFITCLAWNLLHNKILIFDQFDPIASRLKNRILLKFLQELEFRIAKLSDIRIAANVERIFESDRRNWIELPNNFPIDILPTNKLNSQNILFYGGSLFEDRGLEYAIDAVLLCPNWRLEIYGSGPDFALLKGKSFDSPRIQVNKSIEHRDLLIRASTSSIYLAFYDPRISHNKLTASNKLFEAARLQIPILTSRETRLGEYVEKYGLGWAIDYGDTCALVAALEKRTQWTKTDFQRFVESCKIFLEDFESRNQFVQISEVVRKLIEKRDKN